jgi:hypothetical protein
MSGFRKSLAEKIINVRIEEEASKKYGIEGM